MKMTNSGLAMLICITTTISGCAEVPSTTTFEEQLMADGYSHLSSDEIKTTLEGNTLHGKFGTYTVTVFFEPNGTIRGKTVSSSGTVSRDQGAWETSPEGLFCDTWDNWRAGTDCDHVFVRGSEFIMVNLGGMKSSEGKIENGNARGL